MTDLNRLAEEYALASGYKATYDRARLCDGFEAGFRAALECEEVRALVEALYEAKRAYWAKCYSGKSNEPVPTLQEFDDKMTEALTAFDKLKEQK